MSPEKTAHWIEMPFGVSTRVGPAQETMCWMGSRSPMGRGNFERGRGGPLYSIGTLCHEPCKMAEPIETLFGTWTPLDPMKHVLDGCTLVPLNEYGRIVRM